MRRLPLLALALGLSAPLGSAQSPGAVEAAADAPVRVHAASGLAGAADLSTPPDFEGDLTDDDPVQNGKPYDAYTIDLETGIEATITMTSDAFDTYLIVRSPSGQEWSNDDYQSTSVSQVSLTVTEAGRYTIWATAFSEGGRGRYQVRTSSVRARVLSTVSGRLDYEDEQLIKGEYVDTLTIEAPRTGRFYVDLMPLGFQGYARVTSPAGTQTRGQVPYGERSVRMGPFEAAPGTWTVDVTTAAADEVGAYDVRVVSLDEQ